MSFFPTKPRLSRININNSKIKANPHGSAFSIQSEKRDSNPRPSAWEANALPTELFSHFLVAQKYEIFVKFLQTAYKISLNNLAKNMGKKL